MQGIGGSGVRRFTLRSKIGAVVLAVLMSGTGIQSAVGSQPPHPPTPASGRTASHPGAAPWQLVPREHVARECGLDPALLDAAEPEMSKSPYAIFRYGKLCWEGGDDAQRAETYPVDSETKTFGAMLFGLIAGRTGVNESTLIREWVSPAEMNVDPVATAMTRPPLNPDSTVFHVLTQTAHNPSLEYGQRAPWVYDPAGEAGMNSLVVLMDKVVKANPDAFPGSTSARDVAINELFEPLGMTATHWDGVVTSHTLYSNVHDMAKLGLLLLRKGRWGDEQIIDEDYVYRMTHPQIEDVHTGYGYLTWLNAASGVAKPYDVKTEPTCSPFASWRRYPHAPTSEAPDDNGGAPYESKHDVGVFWADGAEGDHVYVHRGLDLIIVVRDDHKAQGKGEDPLDTRNEFVDGTDWEFHRLWRLMRPALIAMDPVFRGDEGAFCSAYRRGAHAPDLLSPWGPESGFGSVLLDESSV